MDLPVCGAGAAAAISALFAVGRAATGNADSLSGAYPALRLDVASIGEESGAAAASTSDAGVAMTGAWVADVVNVDNDGTDAVSFGIDFGNAGIDAGMAGIDDDDAGIAADAGAAANKVRVAPFGGGGNEFAAGSTAPPSAAFKSIKPESSPSRPPKFAVIELSERALKLRALRGPCSSSPVSSNAELNGARTEFGDPPTSIAESGLL